MTTRHTYALRTWMGALVSCGVLGVAACGEDTVESSLQPTGDAATGSSSSNGGASSSGTGSSSSGAGGGSSSGTADGSPGAPIECGERATIPNPWLQTEFAGAPTLTGDYTKRTGAETPVLVHDASVTGAKYGFDITELEAPVDPRVALVNVRVTNLVSNDIYGASFQTAKASGAHIFLSNVYLEPNWPHWVSYSETNYDGMVLDGSEDIFAEDVTVKNWNADCAADIKSKRAQFVCFRTEGNGHRTLRYWNVGPHYLVKSSINNEDGAILWFNQCTGAKVNVYDSTFNGSPTIPADKISCEEGGQPEIVYLTTDPRTTGEMHPMFSAR